MAGLVDEDGEACARSEPAESWLRPAFREIRKKGWVRLQSRMSIMGGRPFGIYAPTPKGLEEAREAKARVKAAREKRSAWGRDLQAALAARKAAHEVTSNTQMEHHSDA
ncbi:hypothetical protein [Paracoccus sp. ME4]|uniref:hypothetical protein n=1 Tax=Paracoccus sp. ME4 TaxID=3138066 RepID=UPI00398B4171